MLCRCIFGADSQEGEANDIFASIFTVCQCRSKKNVSANRRNDFTNRENRAEKHLNSFPQRSESADGRTAHNNGWNGANGMETSFTTVLNDKQPEPVDVRANMQQQVASVRNRRLALQMENRTSVQAALQPKSLKQRLGKGDVLARLGQPMGTLMRGATRSQGFAVRGLRGMNRGGFKVRGNNRWGFFRGVNQMRARGGVTKLRFRQGLRLQGGQLNNAGVLVSRGARNGLGLKGRGRGAGLGGRGGFRGRGMGKPKKIPTKEELDNQLDNYMSMTKSHLDAELDSYMAMAGSDYLE